MFGRFHRLGEEQGFRGFGGLLPRRLEEKTHVIFSKAPKPLTSSSHEALVGHEKASPEGYQAHRPI
jgi:hypothetical protein